MSRLPVFKRSLPRPRLRIFRDEADTFILPFSRTAARAVQAEAVRPNGSWGSVSQPFRPANLMDPLTPARVLHKNRCCPNCRRGGVIPVDLGDGDDRNAAMPVPGSATLVGFYCDACGGQWPV